ncbi:hypothetical protein [Streptomyces sp. NPDC093589]|uniref:hypothetical protein n=1 Tax=Streptomyces sp. NPDC093589 TaxID=3366043 RepID=UPI0038079952
MNDDDVQAAAWHLYLALHGLASAQTAGEVTTGPAGSGDLDHASAETVMHGPLLARRHPELVVRVREVVEDWARNPAGRLVTLLPVLDELGRIAGAELPDTLPPAGA